MKRATARMATIAVVGVTALPQAPHRRQRHQTRHRTGFAEPKTW